MQTGTEISPFDYPGEELEFTELAVNYHQAIFDFFQPYIHGSVLELGAGTGIFTQLLLDAKPQQLSAIEPSPTLFPALQKRFENMEKVQPYHGTLDSYLSNGRPSSFHTAVLVNVLEHIENDMETLRQLHEMLEPSGHLLLFVPAMRILYGVHDKLVGHFRRYSRKELKHKCEEAGFQMVKIFYFDLIGAPLWFFQTKILRRPIHSANTGMIKLFDKYLVPFTLAVEGKVKPPFGKSLVAIFKNV
jgi:SAM-dependent methyltransferase